jgi:hypothetical protein
VSVKNCIFRHVMVNEISGNVMAARTSQQFNAAVEQCKDIFLKKMQDYGSSWRVLRVPSITDQIFIKAQRIRSIEEKGVQKVDEGIKPEYIGIVNYSVIALIQLELGSDPEAKTDPAEIKKLYQKHIDEARLLMEAKNFDYDEAWRQMRINSFTDLILMKLLRVKQIEDNKGKTLISEGIEAGFYDIINYAIFALIKIDEQ